MKIQQEIILDFGRSTLPITVFAKQYDKDSRTIVITPLNSGQRYTLESGVVARLQLTKADGHTVINDCTITDGKIIAELTEQCLTACGVATAEIGLYKGSALLSSQLFYIDVKKAAYDSSAPTSSDEYISLVNTLQQIESSAQTAKDAAEAASNAITAAEVAVSKTEKINISVNDKTASVDIIVTDREGNSTTVELDKPFVFDTWDKIQDAVRMGLAPKLFPVGYEFTVQNEITNKNIVWVVRGYDAIKPAKSGLTHSMILEAKYLYSGADGAYVPIQFDAPEALYYADEELEPDTYRFTVAGASTTSDNGKVFEFTLTQTLPVDGIIMLNNVTGSLVNQSIKTYASYDDLMAGNAIETVQLVLSNDESEAIDLGITDGEEMLNYLSRCVRGSNNYAQSALRQWLNSSEEAGSVWEPTTYYDAPPVWANTLDGYMRGLPADFMAVIAPAAILCRTNSVFEICDLDDNEYVTDTVYTLNDKFFVLSAGEIADSYTNEEIRDGEILEYYEEATNAMCKKYDENGTARNAWLRTPIPTGAYNERVVNYYGNINSSYASHTHGVAPACIIA